MLNDFVIKKTMLSMWFKRVHDHINLIESRVRNIDVNNPQDVDYQYLIDDLETQFENIKIVRKVIKNDAFLRGINHKDIKKS